MTEHPAIYDARRAKEYFSQRERSTAEVFEALAIALDTLAKIGSAGVHPGYLGGGGETFYHMFVDSNVASVLKDLAECDGRGPNSDWVPSVFMNELPSSRPAKAWDDILAECCTKIGESEETVKSVLYGLMLMPPCNNINWYVAFVRAVLAIRKGDEQS